MDLFEIDTFLATLMTSTLLASLAFKVYSLRKEKPFKSDPSMWGLYSVPDQSNSNIAAPLETSDSVRL